MEASGVVFRPIPNVSGAGVDFLQSNTSFSSKPSFSGVGGARKLFSGKKFSGCLSSGYVDNSHLHYYSSRATAATEAATATSVIMCGAAEKVKEEKKMVKAKLKLVKNLSKNLSEFSQMGFGLNPDQNLLDDVKQKMISEATELLIVQLQQLKAEEKELKRKRKGEKAKLKAEKMQERQRLGLEMDSSSSSESSSDGECQQVVDMSCLKMGMEAVTLPQPLVDAASTLTLPSTIKQEADLSGTRPPAVSTFLSSSVVNGRNFGKKCCNGINSCSGNNRACVDINPDSGSRLVSSGEFVKQIEVCMGGKCKKSGGASLLEEFQRAVGIEGAVVGCKCLGKCRDGPNVRVLNAAANAAGGVDDSIRTPTNPLCIGVGLEDVGLIVDNFFGKKQNNFGFATS